MSERHNPNDAKIHGSNFLSYPKPLIQFYTARDSDKMQEERCVNGNDNVGQLTVMRFDNILSSSVICVIIN